MNDSMRTRGFTLIEVLIALVILSICLLGMAGLMAATTKNNSNGSHLTEAATLAQDKLEQLRATPFGMIPLNAAVTDSPVGSTGITYNRSWIAAPNIAPPGNTLDVITVTVSWTDKIPYSISIVSAVPL
jgi:prepilin-type N-terminal cleavage/methylation domain-containing protein